MDFVWHSTGGRMAAHGVLEMPVKAALDATGGLPSPECASDHLPLYAALLLKPLAAASATPRKVIPGRNAFKEEVEPVAEPAAPAAPEAEAEKKEADAAGDDEDAGEWETVVKPRRRGRKSREVAA